MTGSDSFSMRAGRDFRFLLSNAILALGAGQEHYCEGDRTAARKRFLFARLLANNFAMATRSPLKRFLILGFGWAFVLLGFAGLFLPFLQGILFLLVGLYLLSLESARARLLRPRLRQDRQ